MNKITSMKHPYRGSELEFVFEKERTVIGQRGEPLYKGVMTINDPDLKLRSLLESVSPFKDDERIWPKMSALICIKQEKTDDAYHIVHNFIGKMKPIES